MNKESIKNVVSLFLHCQKLIDKPKRLRFGDLKYLLDVSMNEVEFDRIAKSVFNLADHYFLLEKYKHPTALLVDINKLAEGLKVHMNPTQKLVFLTVLAKMIRLNKQAENFELQRALYCIAEIFSFNQKQAESLKHLFLSSDICKEDYSDSILISSKQIDYTKVIDGLRVIYVKDLGIDIWVKNIKSVNNMLCKILRRDSEELRFSELIPEEVYPLNGAIQHLLEKYSLSQQTLAVKMLMPAEALPSFEIPSTERSPRIQMSSHDEKILIEGISSANSPLQTFDSVFYWLSKIKEAKLKHLALHINLSFFNTYTSKILLKIFQKMIDLESVGLKPEFYWYYEHDDEELKEAGEHYASIINRRFSFIPVVPPKLISA